jgi:carbonic anhydrase
MKNKIIILALQAALLLVSPLAYAKNNKTQDVLTYEEQQKLTPDLVIEIFKEGNKRFVKGDQTVRDHNYQIRKTVSGQYPKAIVLSCVDSRVPVEDVFDMGIGDIFVARVAGNFVNEDILGSMEFATKVAGSKLVLVLGHEHCGAVKASIDKVDLGNISSLVKNIAPAVEKAKMSYKGEQSSKNPEFVHEVCQHNVLNTISEIRKRSEILKDLEDSGKIKIIGAIYDMDSGKVDFLK